MREPGAAAFGSASSLAGVSESSCARARLAVSEIVAAELYYGAERVGGSRSATLRDDIDDFLSRLTVMPWQGRFACARIRHQLEALGKPIGNNDLLIAAHAVTLGATLVTNNLREFARIPGLKVENWG